MANKAENKEKETKETKKKKEEKVENIKKEKANCPNCSKKYLVTLDECPYCGYSENKKEIIDDDEDDYEDEELEEDDEEEVVTKKSSENEEVYEDITVNESNDLKTIKTLSIISICISVLTLLLAFIILSAVNDLDGTSTTTTDISTDEEETEYDVSMFTEITASEFIDMFDEDDDTIYFVYTGRSSCSYCVAFLPYLQESVEEYDYTLYYLDITTVTSDEQEIILELDEELEADYGSTPMVFAIQNGKVIDVNYGYTDYDTYASFLEDNEVEEK